MTIQTDTKLRTIRWGILGAGTIAERFASDSAHAEGAAVHAVAARDGERARGFAARHGIDVAYEGYDQLLADDDVDGVYVATPHSLHFEHALACIRAGKSVLVEKPFTVDAKQAEQLRLEAEANSVFLMEAIWTRFNPIIRQLQERLQGGAIGTPILFTANVGPMSVPLARGSGHRLEDPSLGASFMLEALVYPIWVATTLLPGLGEPVDVIAAAHAPSDGIDEAASLLLKGADGSMASMGGGLVFGAEGGPASLVQITGTHGWAEITDSLFDPQSARIGTQSGVETLTADAPSRGFAWEIEDASSAIRSGRLASELAPVTQSVQVMKILDRARESAGLAPQAGS